MSKPLFPQDPKTLAPLPVLTACVIIALTTAVIYALLRGNRRRNGPALDPVVFTHLALVKKESVSHDTRRFTFALPTGPDGLLGLPVGQHITLKYTELLDEVTTRDHQRSYTPITGDDTPGTVTFVIKVYKRGVHPKFPEGGKMSQHLDSLKIGDTVLMRGPKGEWVAVPRVAEGRSRPTGVPFTSRRNVLAACNLSPASWVRTRDHSMRNITPRRKRRGMKRRSILQNDEMISIQSHDGHLRLPYPLSHNPKGMQ
jgi:hypothetical protein